MAEAGAGNGCVQEVSHCARDQHHDADHENPNQQLHLHQWILHSQQNKGDECDSGDAVGLKPVGRWTDRVAGIVTGAVGNHSGIARVVFLDFEDNLHQIRPDVSDLGEDPARNPQRGCAERFADGEANEARPGIVSGNKQQNNQHHHQLDADQHHADAHAGFERNLINRVGFPTQAGEGGPRVGKGIDPYAEPGHAVAARNPNHAEQQNDRHPYGLILQQHSEVEQDDSAMKIHNRNRNFPWVMR